MAGPNVSFIQCSIVFVFENLIDKKKKMRYICSVSVLIKVSPLYLMPLINWFINLKLPVNYVFR